MTVTTGSTGKAEAKTGWWDGFWGEAIGGCHARRKSIGLLRDSAALFDAVFGNKATNARSEITDPNDPELIGLHDPYHPDRMNSVRRPVESR